MDIFPDVFVTLPKFSNMKKTILLLLLAIAGFTVQAQIPNGYYDNANNKTGDELKTALHNIIHDHTEIGYANVWTAFWTTDNKGNNVVWDMYSDGADYTYHYYPSNNDQCGSYDNEGDCYNREHSWCQSWFGDKSKPRCDMHHIYPTDGKVNGMRSNYPYGEVKKASWTSQNGSKLGTPKDDLGYTNSSDNKVFEPIDEYKGDIARGLFYMSVCYYNDDTGWGNSGMTNKSEILPWATTMLLRWSDNDPVSQKEIDRNNAVFEVQGNRNPFIDHPEYARMIWDAGYTPVTTYAITLASVSNGSLSASHSSAAQGSIVQLTATPAPGYTLDSWNVYKTGASSTHVTVTNNSFVMPDYPVTVSATFKTDNTYYTITTGSVSHGNISASHTSAKSGTTITLNNTPETGYSLYSWYVYKTGDMSTVVHQGTTGSFTMPAYNVTVTATFAQGSGSNGDYVKVTSAPSDWSGTYLIVYESDSKAFDGSLTTLDVANNTIPVTITGENTIASSDATNAAKFTIATMTSGYSIQAASGKYIGNASNSNSLTSSDSPMLNTLSYSSNCVNIVSAGGAYLRYNSSDQRFRYYKSGTYSSQQPIQLYKKTSGSSSTPSHTIHFMKNDGTSTTTSQTVNEFEATALQANTFTRTGFVFNGWNTAANGSGTYYADGATVTLLDDLTLYAQWDQLYDITLASVEHGSITASPTSATEGTTITLTATPASGYELGHWTVTDASDNEIEVIENQFEMPVGGAIVSATFVYVGPPFEQKFYLVTSTDQLVEGRTYLIVNTDASKALGTTQNDNNRSAASITISNNTIASIGTDVCMLTLGKENEKWTFFDASYSTNGGYLYAASSSKNYLRTQATNDANGQWTISITSAGVATITAQGTNTHNLLQYNSGATLFSCYSSAQQNVSLFIRSEDFEHPSNETIAQIFSFDKHVIKSGATLTVTGTATCNEASQLIIEDGGQLAHHNDGVKATFKKNIAAYISDSDGWYTIASPFTSFTPSQVATDSYDLYAYDEDGNNEEWINYKLLQNDFPIGLTSGYLYAHNPNTTLRMTGILNNGDYTETVNLSYASNHESIKGYNLLGNPTAHDITINKSASVADGYYYLNNDDTWAYETSNNVPAGRGFLVKANASGQTVTLNPSAKRGEGETIASLLEIDVDGEQAYVKLTEGVSMPLLDFKGRHSNVYLSQEGKNYIMLVRDDADAIALCYQPSPGKHTLSVKTENADLDYLHLIDHLTGNDIDLLANSNYTFESSAKNYSARFQLTFSPKANDDIYGDSFVDGKTVIIDMTGRVVATDRNAKLAPGIYLLRTVNGNEVKTKKIFIN